MSGCTGTYNTARGNSPTDKSPPLLPTQRILDRSDGEWNDSAAFGGGEQRGEEVLDAQTLSKLTRRPCGGCTKGIWVEEGDCLELGAPL
ncbi:hypothetical protein cyc_04616 [Cyclospora cayetanensis]|uniref:Uncharacterized protein n=1 Tax=Cyclospora cayetanensis TaxID=88456 RepID=A0A1D3D4C0_9EIME|nr:hypothetical protein cyc_04616 [Cyclospora cayetanensis]